MAISPNMKLIQAITVGSGGAANIEFTSIPQSYTDLCILVSARSSYVGTGDYLLVNFNNSSINNSSRTVGAYGPSSTFSGSETLLINILPSSGSTTNTFGNNEIYISNYTSSNYKSLNIEGGFESNSSSNWFLFSTSGVWSNSSAINSVKLFLLDGSFIQNSTAYLYGVTKVTSSAKATGGTITFDGTYYYHTFTSSGTFTPSESLTADYLVVAGGGGGGSIVGGGGGGGGLRCTVGATGGNGSLESALSLTAQAYTVTVGSGGAGTSTFGVLGGNGTNSVFESITSNGGGGGGRYNGVAAPTGTFGSGGGGGGGETSGGAGASGTSTQGYAGGNGAGGANEGYAGGGGGGAGQIGSNAIYFSNDSIAGNGGAGVTTFISGISTTYAGGGGGASQKNNNRGAGGIGGGGNGGSNFPSATAGTSGTTNTGGGGGGGRDSGSGNGGSGIVIIRYAG